MTTPTPEASPVWPHWQRILFRFFFIYLLLQISPWQWLELVPVLSHVPQFTHWIDDGAVRAANDAVFHVRPTLVPPNGSGDTSYAWAQMWLYVCLALAGAALWSALDRRRAAYPRLLYWLRTFVRYFIAATALSYGIIKLFRLQMPFPTLSQLATPLGDFLPMRLSWMFIGYSEPYQFFSGAMETVAGLLLLRRSTVRLGLVAATGAFLNVWMINLAYDVPVKLFASHLLLYCTFLLALDAPRLWTFFVLNRAVPGTAAYEPHYRERWHHWAAAAAKVAMFVVIVLVPLDGVAQSYRVQRHAPAGPIAAGVYDVRYFVRNGDTMPALVTDRVRWRDVIFDDAERGSVGSVDPNLWQVYGRGYFRYAADPSKHTLALSDVTRIPGDSTLVGAMHYALSTPDTVRLWGKFGADSLRVELVRSPRHFQLAERQFHWLSEYNR